MPKICSCTTGAASALSCETPAGFQKEWREESKFQQQVPVCLLNTLHLLLLDHRTEKANAQQRFRDLSEHLLANARAETRALRQWLQDTAAGPELVTIGISRGTSTELPREVCVRVLFRCVSSPTGRRRNDENTISRHSVLGGGVEVDVFRALHIAGSV